MTDEKPAQERFTDFYDTPPPWDIGKPQRQFVEAADRITGKILDAGCGTGENALYFASLGREVVGVDFAQPAIAAAKQKAEQRNLAVDFRVHDATRLTEMNATFDSVIDCGLFHIVPDDARRTYVEQLTAVTAPGGGLFLACFSDAEPEGEGPRRVSEAELRAAFADGWRLESLTACRFEIRPEWSHLGFTKGGPHAWFCEIRREE